MVSPSTRTRKASGTKALTWFWVASSGATTNTLWCRPSVADRDGGAGGPPIAFPVLSKISGRAPPLPTGISGLGTIKTLGSRVALGLTAKFGLSVKVKFASRFGDGKAGTLAGGAIGSD